MGYRKDSPILKGQEFYLDGQPARSFRPTLPHRSQATSDGITLTSGVMHSTAVVLYAGDSINRVTFRTGSTGTTTPANYWVALYDTSATPALLAQSADQTTAALAANTTATISLQSTVVISTTGVYYVSFMMNAATPPTLNGAVMASAAVAGNIAGNMVVLAQTSGAALTSTAPATITGGTPSTGIPFMVVRGD